MRPRGRADRARPVRRPTRSARSGQAPAPDRRGNDRGAARLCRRSPARPATSRPSTHTSPALRRFCLRGRRRNRERARKTGAELGDGTNPSPRLRSGCYGLGLATAASGRAPGHARRARIAEICFFCAAPSIGKGQAHRRALSFVHFPAALVTDENGLSCQFDPPSSRVSSLKSNGNRPENGSWDSPSNARLSTGFLVPSTRRMQVPAEIATPRRSGPGIRRLRRGRGFSSQSKQAGGARPALRRGPPGRLRESPRGHLDDRRPRRGRDRPGAARGGAARARPRRDRRRARLLRGSTSRSSSGGRPRTRSCTRRPRRSARRASA